MKTGKIYRPTNPLNLTQTQSSAIEFADLVLFASIKGLLDELDSNALQQFLGYPPLNNSGVSKESNIGFDDVPNARANLKKWAETLKLKVEPDVGGIYGKTEITAVRVAEVVAVCKSTALYVLRTTSRRPTSYYRLWRSDGEQTARFIHSALCRIITMNCIAMWVNLSKITARN